MSLRLGAIADDFTGATDLANTLVRAGMRVVQLIGVPEAIDATDEIDEIDAVVIALKTRTIPAVHAVSQSVQALAWLQAAGAQQVYFKYCSTFDSTPAGNIGPVAEALLQALGSDFTIACPAFPENGRTVYQGHLFVGDQLLSDSGMRHHPLTPMTDANLVRVLAAQCRGPVGLVGLGTVTAGVAAIRARCAQMRADGVRIAIVDAVTDEDLRRIGAAVAGLPLVTGGSGLATGLPAQWGIRPSAAAVELPPAGGHAAVVAGSVSTATQAQVAHFLERGLPTYAVDPLVVAAGGDVAAEALRALGPRLGRLPVLVHSRVARGEVAQAQRQLGVAEAGALVEATLAAVALALVGHGVRRLVVAGGETAAAVMQALGVRRLRIGAQIDPGVPWCVTRLPTGDRLHVALKSGNFGAADFFVRAFDRLD